MKEFFHNEGIHSTTIQPEFIETADALGSISSTEDCMLACPKGPLTAPDCHASTCCPPVLRSPRRPSSVSNTDGLVIDLARLDVTNKSDPNLATLTVQVQPGSAPCILNQHLFYRKIPVSSLESTRTTELESPLQDSPRLLQ